MLNIDVKRLVHEASQEHIQMASDSLIKHLQRTEASFLTKSICESLILALKDKSSLATELYKENDRLKETLKELAK